MGYTGFGGGGLCAPSLPWICVCMRIMPLCVSVELLCLSVIYLSLSLHVSACLSVCMSLSPSLSICGLVLADQGSQARYQTFQDSNSVRFLTNLSWWKPIIVNYASFIRTHYPLLWVKVGLTSCWFSSALVSVSLHHKWTYMCRMIPLLLAQLYITGFLLG